MSSFTAVGSRPRRLEGREKLSGSAGYVADVARPGSLYARLVLSPHPHARIKTVAVEAARQVPGVVEAYSGKDLGGANLLALEEVYYVGEPVAVVVGETEEAAEDGADAVAVDYEVLPAVVDPEGAMRDDAPLVRGEPGHGDDEAGAHGIAVGAGATSRPKPRNVSNMTEFKGGDLAKGWAEADAVVEDTYRLARVHQGYMETQGSIAERRGDGGFTVWTSTQAAFGARHAAAAFLRVPDSQVNVVAATVGGGFGGKWSLLEPLTAEISRRLGAPVRAILDRTQDFLISHPGPAAVIRLKMGAKRDGTLTALEAEVIMDTGCEGGAGAGSVAMTIAGTYRCANFDVVGYDVLTHKTACGAYRAPGAPQAYFALESHMDRLAQAVGMDPIEFRLRSACKEGDTRPNGRAWPRIGLIECLERARAHPLWQRRGSLGPDEGVGVAAGGWGGGTEPATAACRVDRDGTLTVQVGSVDLTGVNTSFALIAAEAYGVAPERVRVVVGDTDNANYAGGSGGSKTTYTVGAAVLLAAEEARRQTLEMAADRLEAAVGDLDLADGKVSVRGAPSRSIGVGDLAGMANRFGSRYKPLHGQGRANVHVPSPGFAVHLVKVKVDRETGAVRVTGYVAVQDVGRAINAAEVEGQIRGGVVQGIGRALFERLHHDEGGQLANATLADYAIPTSAEAPEIEVELVEVPSAHGPFGAKGVGEPPAIPGAAAIVNAVQAAVGVRLSAVPIANEVVLDGLGAFDGAR